MFLTASDFNILPYNIPNVETNNSFQTYVNEHEADVLKSLMGIVFYTAFVEGLAEPSPEQRWLDLRDGATYELKGRTYEWPGMKKMLKPFIYKSWLSDTWDNDTGIGVVQSKAENAQKVSPSKRIWNAYAAYQAIAGGPCAQENTLYGYLTVEGIEQGTFDDSFDDSFGTFQSYFHYYFQVPGSENSFGI